MLGSPKDDTDNINNINNINTRAQVSPQMRRHLALYRRTGEIQRCVAMSWPSLLMTAAERQHIMLPHRMTFEWNPSGISNGELMHLCLLRYTGEESLSPKSFPHQLDRVLQMANFAVQAATMAVNMAPWLDMFNAGARREVQQFMSARDWYDESSILRRIIIFEFVRGGICKIEDPDVLCHAVGMAGFVTNISAHRFVFYYLGNALGIDAKQMEIAFKKDRTTAIYMIM